MSGGGRSAFLSARLRAQETAFTRDQDLHAYKSIRDALKGTGQLEAARERVEKALARESEGVDVLAEVSAARAMAAFKEEDLPEVPITIRPMRYAPTKLMNEAEEFMKHVQPPKPNSTFQIATGSYSTITRGRYEYLNDFMKSMEVQPEERRPMTQREIYKAQKQFHATKTAYIAGAFAAGTALCCGAAAISWYLTKQTMGVKDHKEYAEKMRRDLPQTTEVIQKSAVGGTIQRMKSGLQDQLDKSEGFQNFKRRNTFEGMTTKRTNSGSVPNAPPPVQTDATKPS